MRNLIPAWLRVTVIFLAIVWLAEYFIETESGWAIIEYPILQLTLLVALLFLISAEVILSAIENTLFQTLDAEAKERYMRARQERIEKYSLNAWMKKTFGSRPEQEERDLELDHNYDGIKELDNKLPTWWLYSFYASIIFAAGYMVYYHVLDGDNQVREFENEMAAAAIALEEYKKNAPDLIDAESVVVLTEAADIEKGNSLYQMNCMACHAADGGGGIGPNLVDDHWILGGGVKEIFATISEGGRSGKGMIAWKSTMSPLEIQQVSSYIISLKGTTPANPKEPEGEMWTAE
ncbi:MAG TPA: cbb3-type cytochrome c oxidase N-terminal domain-containing protein [Gillisia sp.]|nr:cbb3-type cytochrome c oxidase N-terminal domain-containing protein [Gillisia sp.]